MSTGVLLSCVVVVSLLGGVTIFDKIALAQLEGRHYFFARFYLMFIILLTPMALYFDEVRAAVWRADHRIILSVAGSTVLTLVGLFVYYRALEQGEASKVVPFCASYPLVTLLLSSVILKEPLTAGKLAGTLMVLSGAFLLTRP